MDVRPAVLEDRTWIEQRLRGTWGSPKVALRSELIDLIDCPALVAGEQQGMLHYRKLDGTTGEILTLEAFEPGLGIGSALIEAYKSQAARDGLSEVVVVTTNDNTNALRFYQRHGFVLAEVRLGAVTEARRTLKPEIPMVSEDGIPIRDEIELRLPLAP